MSWGQKWNAFPLLRWLKELAIFFNKGVFSCEKSYRCVYRRETFSSHFETYLTLRHFGLDYEHCARATRSSLPGKWFHTETSGCSCKHPLICWSGKFRADFHENNIRRNFDFVVAPDSPRVLCCPLSKLHAYRFDKSFVMFVLINTVVFFRVRQKKIEGHFILSWAT